MLLHRHRGFTLVETLIAAGVFVAISLSLYQAFTSLLTLVERSRTKVVASSLANEQFEIIRNLSYANVGIVGGLPAGVLAHEEVITRNGIPFSLTRTVRNIDDPFDGTIGGTPNDTTASDYKLVQIDIECDSCKNFAPLHFMSHVAPRSLETPTSSGALFVQVIDANGQPIAGADVHIVNLNSVPTITIDDTTNNSGLLQIVDAPPGVNRYRITVTKDGYSTEATYAIGGVGNPNPLKPHATVVVQQVTQLSFAIDRLSTLSVESKTSSCAAVPAIDFTLRGAKTIGTNPVVYKYSSTLVTDGNGVRDVANLEWDSYAATLIDPAYDMAGSIPLTPVSVAPGAQQNIKFIVRPKTPQALLVTIKDAATGLSVSDASVRIAKSGFDNTLVTGRGFLSQTDWSAGGGQAEMSNPAAFWSTDGRVNTSIAGEARLTQLPSSTRYNTSGVLTSSTFDTGGASNFYQISWLPQDQNPLVGSNSVRFQIATNNDNATWDYAGPDGTPGTYYSVANTNLHVVHNGKRYLRYKMFLQTANDTVTPFVSDVAITFNSLCVPPGQVFWNGLTNGTYTVTVTKEGYQTYTGSIAVSTPWKHEEITLLPQ